MKIKEIMSARLRHLISDYSRADRRFDEILRTKLGVTRSGVARGGATSSAATASRPPELREATMYYRVIDRDDVTKKSGATAEELDGVFRGTAMEGLGKAFERAEREHGINAWFLAAVATLESGYGTSAIARDKNNLFGFCAYDDSPYVSAKKFGTKEKGVDYVAGFLAREYLSPEGDYYAGLSVDDIGKHYATDRDWSKKVYGLMSELSRRAARETAQVSGQNVSDAAARRVSVGDGDASS